MSEFCKTERDGRVLTVTITRPEVMNSLHPPANQELAGSVPPWIFWRPRSSTAAI